MTLRAGLLASGIAFGAIGGAATGAAGRHQEQGLLWTEALYASMSPLVNKTHTVAKGENDWTIAKKYGVRVADLHKANPDTNWRALQIGQKLNVPVAASATAAANPGGKHTVQKGENDNTIARKYGVTVAQIHGANPGVDWRKLQIGQKINLPGGAEDTSGIKAITTSKVKVTAGTVNVRKEPTTTSAVRTTVNRGMTATVLDRQGAWYELRFPKGTVGWVRGDMLSAVAEKPAGSSAPKTTEVAKAGPMSSDLADSIIGAAWSMIGTRYVWGGTSRGGVDCSGFTTVVFARNGIRLPRTSVEQSNIGEWIDREDLQPGDLLFFVTGRSSGRINHVGIYIGDGDFIHASSSKGRVVVTKLKEYGQGYAGARRVAALQKQQPTPVEQIAEPEPEPEELFPSRKVYDTDKTGK